VYKRQTLSLRKQTGSLLSAASEANPDLYEAAAFNEVFLRDFDQAIRHYERWVSLVHPEVPPLNLGFLYLISGREDEGRNILDQAELRARKAASASPGNWENWFELAEIASMRGDTAAALQHLQKALENGLDREWWLMMEKGPDSIPDPVFETILHTIEYQKLMEPVFQARAEMRSEIEKYINSK
jgi:tetratricopeptide (TPR) repeat protein